VPASTTGIAAVAAFPRPKDFYHIRNFPKPIGLVSGHGWGCLERPMYPNEIVIKKVERRPVDVVSIFFEKAFRRIDGRLDVLISIVG
jgi:hypothetical protein